MAIPRLVEQLVITTDDKPGMLAEVTGIIADAQVNIDAICAYGEKGKAVFYIITRQNDKVKQAIQQKGWSVEEDEVVVVDVENEPGSLNKLAKKLKAKGINLLFCYGSTSEHNSHPCHFVFKAENCQAAMEALK